MLKIKEWLQTRSDDAQFNVFITDGNGNIIKVFRKKDNRLFFKGQIIKKYYNDDSQIVSYENIANFHKDSKSLSVATYYAVKDKMEFLDANIKLINDLE